MGRGKKITTYFFVAVLLSLLVWTFCYDVLTDCAENVKYGTGNTTYYVLSAANDGSIWAMGRRNESYELACGDLDGGKWRARLNDKALPDDFVPVDIFAVSENYALLKGYCVNDGGVVSKLQLYLIGEKGKKVETLLSKDIAPGADRQKIAQFSSFACYNDKVFFLLWDSGNAYLYELSLNDMSLRMTGSFACDYWRAALVLSDGKLAIVSEKEIISMYSAYGVRKYDLEVEGCVSALNAGRDSFFYFDSAAQSYNEVGAVDDEYYILQRIPADGTLPITVQPGGSALWLEDGKIYRYDGAPVELKGILYRSPQASLAILVGMLLAILLLAFLATMILRGKRQISLLTRSAVLMLALLALAIGFMKIYLLPESKESELANAQANVEIVADLGLQILRESDGASVPEETARHIGRALEDSGFYNAYVSVFHYAAGGVEILATTNPELESGTVIVGSDILMEAKHYGTVSSVSESISGPLCEAVASDGTYLIFLQADFSAAVAENDKTVDKLGNYLFVSLAEFACVVLFVLWRVWNGLRRLIKGMDLVTAGDYDVVMSNPSGDELEDLSISMNNLTGTLRESALRSRRIDQNYMRFIPEETIKLMGVERLEDVTRETVANHRMVVMTVHFTLPEENIPTEQLFSDINTVIQRTIFAAVAYAGNSFNFTHDGYNVVFEEDFAEMSFHAALAIKEAADAVNKEREFAGRAPVELCIAMDRGLVQMGIVGDELHMVPAAVSLCLKKNEQMLRLCRTLKAGILFSETMGEGADDSNYRYVGNYEFNSGKEKVYELYDGDSYLTAQRKRDTQEEFDTAMREFYRGNYSAAKAILLHLARTGSSCDGSVSYYLNKADLYEQHPPKTPLLNVWEE